MFSSFLTILGLRGQGGAPAGLLGGACRCLRGPCVGVGARVAGAPLHSARPTLTLTRGIAARPLCRGAAVLNPVSRASPDWIKP